MSLQLRDILACPVCGNALTWTTSRALCASCGRSYEIRGDIPILIPGDPAAADDHVHTHDRPHDDVHGKVQQAAYFDQLPANEFEIHRPFKSPALYRWMIDEKMRRSLAPILAEIEGLTALVVCGGSGMEAEYLGRLGAIVVTSDISYGASRRARERASTRGLALDVIVADAEHLPLRTRSVDLVVVHDGLHHLPDPYLGIAEMARVARRFLVISEPARATVTEIAIRLGIAQATEESGNKIARLDTTDLARRLAEMGYDTLAAGRYGLYYRHMPGFVMRLFSRPGLLQVAITFWRLANAGLGYFGNKLVVVATRTRRAV